MRRSLGHGIVGLVALLLMGCGGTVDLETEDDGTPGSPTGSGGTAQSVGAGAGGTGAAPGSAGGSAGSGSAGSGNAGSGNAGSGGAKVPRELVGVLAYDADPDGLGRVIYMTSASGSGCTESVTEPSVQAKQPAFSADGSRLAYAAQVDGIYQIHVRDLGSGNVEQVTDLPLGATSPAFSPDGTQIAFVTGDPDLKIGKSDAGNLMLVDLETLDVSLVSDPVSCCYTQYLSPVFNGPNEILVGTGTDLVGIDLTSGDIRDLVPITGRIPNPQHPSPAPDGLRYVFSDFCGGEGLDLYVARIDGSSGDTCTGAVAIDTGHRMTSADWGPQGFIAAEINSPEHGVLFIDDISFAVIPLDAPAARNPAWAPVDAGYSIWCE